MPLTVGTNLSLDLYDSRAASSISDLSFLRGERLDSFSNQPPSKQSYATAGIQTLLNPTTSTEYAHLYQPGPLSILHLPSNGNDWNGSGEIYVAGRFPSILAYDRRFFPKLRGTIHSGARLCSMAALPYPFASIEKDLARRGELSGMFARNIQSPILESRATPVSGRIRYAAQDLELATAASIDLLRFQNLMTHTVPDIQ